jgi:hypothetical protein
MNLIMKRRELFRRAVASAGAVFIGAAPVRVIWAQGQRPRLFTSCTVIRLNGNVINGVNSGGPVALTLGPEVDVWKGRHGMAVGDVKEGDVIDVVGEASESGAFVAKEITINIVNVYGRLLSVSQDTFVVEQYRPDKTGLLFGFTVNRGFPTAFMRGQWGDFSEGLYVQALGRLEPDRSISTTRVWLYNSRPADAVGRR